MYLQRINTTVSIMGLVVYVTYFVTNQNAVEWYLNQDWYGDDGDCSIKGPGIELLEVLLRRHWSSLIKHELFEEFQDRMYEEEARLAARQDDLYDTF